MHKVDERSDHALFTNGKGEPLLRYWKNAISRDEVIALSQCLRDMKCWMRINVPIGSDRVMTRRATAIHTINGAQASFTHGQQEVPFDSTIKRIVELTKIAVNDPKATDGINVAWSSWLTPREGKNDDNVDYLREKPERINTVKDSIFVVSMGHPREMIFKPPKPRKQKAKAGEGKKNGNGSKKSPPRVTLMTLLVESGSVLEFCAESRNLLLRQIRKLKTDPPHPDPFADLFQIRLARAALSE